MKWIILALISLLSLASIAVYSSRKREAGALPVIYMAGTPGKETEERQAKFHQWLKDSGNGEIDLRLDAVNSGMNKIIMQGVSGIAADIIQANGGVDLGYYQSIGLLADLTDLAKAGNYTPEHFERAIRQEMLVDGRQYGCPASIYLLINYINRKTFEDLGLEVPPSRMTWDEFEKRGKEFVAKANPPGQKTRRFFLSAINPFTLRRSMGLDVFNETLTRCTLDDPRNVEVLKLIHKWTAVDRLIPSGADMSALVSDGDAGAFGPRLYQFKIGNIAIIGGGNYLTPALRRLGEIPLAVSAPPYKEFPNAVLGTQLLSIYAGSKSRESASLYLEFLQSDAYFKTLVENGDGIPTTTKHAHHPDYLRPAAYPNEWGCNEEIVRSVEEIGFPYTISPFVLFAVYNRIDKAMVDRFMTGVVTAEEAAARTTEEVNAEIKYQLQQRPALQARYDELCKVQEQIDELRSKGKKVPLSMISNPFHRAYYQFKGWSE